MSSEGEDTRTVTPEAASDVPEDLEQLRRRFEEFRNTRPGHARQRTISRYSYR
jgi:hypothetical protein